MYSGFLDEIDFQLGSCPRAGIVPCTEFAGTYPSGKSTIKSSVTNCRQFIPDLALNIPRMTSSEVEQSSYEPPSTIVLDALMNRSWRSIARTCPSILTSHRSLTLRTFKTFRRSRSVNTCRLQVEFGAHGSNRPPNSGLWNVQRGFASVRNNSRCDVNGVFT